MDNSEIVIRKGKLKEALALLSALPEFDPLLNYDYYSDRLNNHRNLILVATIEDQVVGCKVGYDKFQDGSFYSWLGGVLPKHRKKSVARQLSVHQEKWAKANGYSCVKFKTLNKHKAMIAFAIMNGFNVYNVKPKDELENYRIELIKDLL